MYLICLIYFLKYTIVINYIHVTGMDIKYKVKTQIKIENLKYVLDTENAPSS